MIRSSAHLSGSAGQYIPKLKVECDDFDDCPAAADEGDLSRCECVTGCEPVDPWDDIPF